MAPAPPQEVILTPQQLITICKATDGYSTPSLNDRLYIHYKKLTHLRNLEPYTGLLVLYAEGNQLQDCSGLEGPHQTLKCLYLQQNSLSNITGLSICTKLTTLNLASNMLTSLQSPIPFSSMHSLHTLNLASNQLKTFTDLDGLLQCRQTLSCLDLSYNQLSAQSEEQQSKMFDFFTSFTSLKILYLHHNPICQHLPSYRKALTAKLIHLTYLDERPVTESDHRLAVAYMLGGMEAEQKERRLIAEEARQSESRRVQDVCELVTSPDRDDVEEAAAATGSKPDDKIKVIDSSDSDTDDIENIQHFANQQRTADDELHIQRVLQKWEARKAGGGAATVDDDDDEERISVVEEVVDVSSTAQPPIRPQATIVASVDTMD